MITMNELVDLRMQQHIAHEIYRQQIMQRIPDPFPAMLPIPVPRHVIMPPRITLPGVEVTLQNDDLWKQFHQIGTEMIITKSGRRMFPSMRLSLSGLEDESNYCVLLEMVPIGDCRYKFSGSQWVPAGGAEPQSPQRMYLHPDSPASGSHWQAQPILFNKVKLTNNTLDNNGHVVLASMHKYQPRIHIIRTSDLTQIPWAPQQAFVFPETEFVAVTAYQNDRITKLKIDNNPFAKGFRETGQSRCKRKMSSSPEHQDHHQHHHDSTLSSSSPASSAKSTMTVSPSDEASVASDKQLGQQQLHQEDDRTSTTSSSYDGPNIKRIRSNGSACSISSLDEGGFCSTASSSSGTCSPNVTIDNSNQETEVRLQQQQQHQLSNNHFYGRSMTISPSIIGSSSRNEFFMHHLHHNMQSILRPSLVDFACTYFSKPQPAMYSTGSAQHVYPFVGSNHLTQPLPQHCHQQSMEISLPLPLGNEHASIAPSVVVQHHSSMPSSNSESTGNTASMQVALQLQQEDLARIPPKRNNFTISAILGGSS